jgi:murein DD-endopeptidase MepM/ murein hydrolase activator NlpD
VFARREGATFRWETGVVQFRGYRCGRRDGRSTTFDFIQYEPVLQRRPRRTSRRYTIVVADRRTGVYRRLSLNPKPVIFGVLALFSLPILVGLGLRWSAHDAIAQLQTGTEVLELENRSYRAATGELTAQLQSLQAAIAQIGERSTLDPNVQRAIERLPALVKSRAAGGPPRAPQAAPSAVFLPGFNMPEDTFGVLRDLLYSLEGRLRSVQVGVERRQALAAATPTIWPAQGWLTDSFGTRADPFTGEDVFHAGLDISADRGQPVYATAKGTVQSAGRSGAYGNVVVLDHGFGLMTRYAHLQAFTVRPGDAIERGAAIGTVGSTGRSTGDHVHYEVLANGQTLNPLRFLVGRAR